MKLKSNEKLGWMLVLLFMLIILLSAFFGCKSKPKYIICNRDICDTVEIYSIDTNKCVTYIPKCNIKIILCKEYIITKLK